MQYLAAFEVQMMIMTAWLMADTKQLYYLNIQKKGNLFRFINLYDILFC